MSIHHLDTFRHWFGDPEAIYCSVRTDPRTSFPHTDGICTYILEYADGLRCVGIDDPWTGPAREGCPADIGIRWRIEGTAGIALGSLGWCLDPYTSPSTLRYARDWRCPIPGTHAAWQLVSRRLRGTMAQLLVALEQNREPEISGRDNLNTMALVEAAYLSAAEHRRVSPQYNPFPPPPP
jgi:predicted dehydrogenase